MIPNFQKIMLPLLKILSDEKEHTFRDLVERLAAEFNLTETERKELLASGNQTVFDNRVGWPEHISKKQVL